MLHFLMVKNSPSIKLIFPRPVEITLKKRNANYRKGKRMEGHSFKNYNNNKALHGQIGMSKTDKSS